MTNKIYLIFLLISLISGVVKSQGFSESFSTGTLPAGWNNSYHGSNGAAWSFTGGEARIYNNAGVLGNSTGPSWLISSAMVPEAGYGTLVFSARFPVLGPLVTSAFTVKISDGVSTNYPAYVNLVQVSRSVTSAGGVQEYRLQIPENYWGKSCYIAFTQTVSGALTGDSVSIDNIRLESDPLYSRQSGLSSDAIWSETANGTIGQGNFTRNTSIIIQSGHQVQFNEVKNLFNITNNAGANLIFTTPGTTVNGSVSNKGMIDSRSVEISFTGKYKQYVDGDWFAGNLRLVNPSGLEWVAGTLRMFDRLNVNSGSLITNGNLLLVSDSLSSGSIGPIGSTAIQGTVAVQKYYGQKRVGWNLLSAPVTAKLVDLNSNFYTAGYTGSDNPSGVITAYSYNEKLTGEINGGLVPAVNSNQSFVPVGVNYIRCIDNQQTTLPVTLTLKGTINQGNITTPLDYTNTGNLLADGVNFLGNPFPAGIDFSKLAKVNVQDRYWSYNTQAGVLDSWNGKAKVGLMNANGTIGIGEGFLVAANQAGASVSFDESYKSTTTPVSTSKAQLALTIKSQETGLFDVTLFNLDASAAKQFEAYDSPRLNFSDVNAPAICIKEANNQLSINSWPSLHYGDSVMLGIKASKTGFYTLSRFRQVGLDTFNIVLINLVSGQRYLVDSLMSVELQLVSSVNYQSWALVFEQKEFVKSQGNICYNDNTGYLVARGPGLGPWTYVWKNSNGEVVRQQSGRSTNDTLTGVPSGQYTLQIISPSPYSTISKSVVIANPNDISVQTKIYPETCPQNNDGKIVVTGSGGTGKLSFFWSNQQVGDSIYNLKSGNYSLTVLDENFCVKNFNSFIVTEPDTLRVSIFAPDSVNKFQTVPFTSSTNLPVIGFTWDFGDGSFSYTEDAQHIYTMGGIFTVELNVEGEHCSAISKKRVVVRETVSSIQYVTGIEPFIIKEKSGNWILIVNEDAEKCEILNELGQIVWIKKELKRGEEVQLPTGQAFSAYFVRIMIGEKAYSKQIRFY